LFKKIIILMVSNLIFLNHAFALRTDFESVRKFHDQEIEQLLRDYTLEDSLTVRAELKRKDQELKDQQIVDIPGLYQKTGEANERGIENVLNLYERKFVIIKKREVAEKEIDLVKQALSERLYLPKDTVFTTLDNTPKLDDAVKNLKSDFLFGAYSTLIKNGQFLWILIFSIGFIIALWILAKAWKSKSESAGGGEFTISGGGGAPAAEAATKPEDSGSGKEMTINMSNSEFETFNFVSLCQNINSSFEKAPGSTAHMLWHHLADLQSQIQFHEILRIQNQVPAEVRDLTYDILDKVFSFEKRASKNLPRRNSKSIHKETLSTISVELARLKFVKPNELVEKCFSNIYPDQADHITDLFMKGLGEHHVVLYKLFKDEFMSFISVRKDDSILPKINDLLTFDPETDHATDAQYKSFADFLSKTSLSEEAANKKKPVNSKIVNMIYNLSETELSKIEAMKSNEELKSEIPSFDWIQVEDQKMLKEFFSNLSGPEIKYLIDFDAKYNSALSSMDERAQFRFKERMNKEASMALNWKEFRQKIKKHYSYQAAGSNETNTQKAS
jgi:hypothetical protein